MRGVNVIGHGIDIVEIARIRHMLDDHGERFIQRCFTKAEQQYAEAAKAARAERYAARFAAKEAILKALGTGLARGANWLDMQIIPEPGGRPLVELSGRCAQIAHERGIAQWHISLSHTAALASASVIACGTGEQTPAAGID